jgi:hypothetical protein
MQPPESSIVLQHTLSFSYTKEAYALVETFSANRPSGGFRIFGEKSRLDSLGMRTVQGGGAAARTNDDVVRPVGSPYVMLTAWIEAEQHLINQAVELSLI